MAKGANRLHVTPDRVPKTTWERRPQAPAKGDLSLWNPSL